MRKRSGYNDEDLVKRLQEKEEKMIEIRRHLHEHQNYHSRIRNT